MKHSFHLIMIMVLTVFSLVLFLINRMLGLDVWILPVFLVELLFCWYLFISKRGSEKFALFNFCFFLMVEVFYFAVHVETLYESTAVIVIMIFLFAASGERFLLPAGAIAGLAGMIMHQWLSGGFEAGRGDISYLIRTGWQFLLVPLTAMIARKIMSSWEEAQRAYQKEILAVREENNKVNNFLANVSHEIRTPVNAVIGLTGVLEKGQLPAPVRNDLKAISEAGHRVAEQISDILDFTEIDMDKLSVNKSSYMINSVVNDLLTQISFMEKNGLELIVDMESDIPSVMAGDESKIKKILWHLIGNGFKFTNDGGVYVHLKTVKKPYGVNLVITVEDTGIGMDEKEIAHIYDKFYQSDSGRSRMAGGLGLGIPIISGFVKAMGGMLSIESQKGKGTLVQVSIPQEVVNEAPCISVRDKEKCVVAGFLGFITTNHPRIRAFYMNMITHLIEGVGIPFLRMQSIDELKKLLQEQPVTHLFVGTGEYANHREFIDSLSHDIHVAVVAERGSLGQVKPGIIMLNKPFYGSQIANVLNQKEKPGYNTQERMLCPGVRVLVVDDEPMNLMVAQGIFESYGMVVTTAGSGPEAISICEQHSFDIIFMDHMMPEMDGVEAMKRLRLGAVEKKQELCIVALTANAISSAKEMFLSEGFDGFIPKPIEITDLERVLKYVLPKSAIVFERIEVSYAEEEEDDPKEQAKEDAASDDQAEEDRSGYGKENRKENGNEGRGETLQQDGLGALKKCGVDVDAGLKYCRGDEELYRQILAEYAGAPGEKAAQLQQYFEASDWKDYAIRVHAVKSTSKMIGAGEVSELARTLELAAKGGDTETVNRNHAPFMEKYEELIGAILESGDRGNEEDSPAAAKGEEALEFNPANTEDGEDEAVEFVPVKASADDEALEFAPVTKAEDTADDEALEFAPANTAEDADGDENGEDGALEFAPAGHKEGEN